VVEAERPIDVDAFLRRLAEVLIDVDRQPDGDSPND